MDPQDRNRRVRNAGLVLFGLLTVMTCLLWWRSYSRVDVLYGNLPGLGAFEIHAREGSLELIPGPRNRGWAAGSQTIDQRLKRVETIRQFNLQVARSSQATSPMLRLPLWVLVVVFGLAFALLQIKRAPRFSLRTLFIATVVVAVLLGLAVWLAG